MRLIPHTSLVVLLGLGLMNAASVCLRTTPARAKSAPVSQAEVDALKTEVERDQKRSRNHAKGARYPPFPGRVTAGAIGPTGG